MSRRRGDAPPDHPLDTHDTGRDHLTSPHKKNDGLHAHSCQNTVETAAAPTNAKEHVMSVTIKSNQPNPPKGFFPVDDTDPDSVWSKDDLDFGAEYVAQWTPEAGVAIYAGNLPVGADDIVAAINDLIQFYVGVRNAQAEHAAQKAAL